MKHNRISEFHQKCHYSEWVTYELLSCSEKSTADIIFNGMPLTIKKSWMTNVVDAIIFTYDHIIPSPPEVSKGILYNVVVLLHPNITQKLFILSLNRYFWFQIWNRKPFSGKLRVHWHMHVQYIIEILYNICIDVHAEIIFLVRYYVIFSLQLHMCTKILKI